MDSIEEWERKRKWAAGSVVANVVHVASSASVLYYTNYVDRDISDYKSEVREDLMERLTNKSDKRCRHSLRMGVAAFAKLVQILRVTNRLSDTWNCTVEEQLAKFLHILAHNVKNRVIGLYFQRSSETISRQFHRVLNAIISLEGHFIKQADGSETPLEITSNAKFWPYFKDCIGAIDGSHFRVKVAKEDVPRYRGRKEYPTQNVLAACTFDLKFTYILAGWEGSASDSRILNNALRRENDNLSVPEGKYYLADAGFMLKKGFLVPFRSTRYHLKEYSVQQPENTQEIFNHRHSSLRNAIERAFGVLKKRFPIIASGIEPQYPIDTQTDIILVSCILHNYLMGVDPDPSLIARADKELEEQEPAVEEPPPMSLADDCRVGETLRHEIASVMWNDYNANRGR